MLIGVLIKDENDWADWKRRVSGETGKSIINIFDEEPSPFGHGIEREGAMEEVEAFDDDSP